MNELDKREEKGVRCRKMNAASWWMPPALTTEQQCHLGKNPLGLLLSDTCLTVHAWRAGVILYNLVHCFWMGCIRTHHRIGEFGTWKIFLCEVTLTYTQVPNLLLHPCLRWSAYLFYPFFQLLLTFYGTFMTVESMKVMLLIWMIIPNINWISVIVRWVNRCRKATFPKLHDW